EQGGRARAELLSAPIPVRDGGTSATGSVCDLAYDGTGRIHLIFRDDTHPSLWYGTWNGTSWSLEFVDGMGFNVGGQVGERMTLAVDPSNNPHVVYTLDGKLSYATKSAGTWTKERVDTQTPLADTRFSLALNPAQSNRATVAYQGYVSGSYRVVFAHRTGPGAWTQTATTFPGSTSSQYLAGDLLINATGVLHVPYYVSGSPYYAHLGAVSGTTASSFSLNPNDQNSGFNAGWTSAAWNGANRILLRTYQGLFDVTVGSPLSSSTFTHSIVEASGTSHGDIAAAGGKPYLLHMHGSSFEIVSTGTGNYWSYTQVGSGGSGRFALAVNSAGVASICYQSNGRIFFQ
ncbi:MAG: hypothetical protein ACK4N5_25885, partial [Myxococcales bacterium]